MLFDNFTNLFHWVFLMTSELRYIMESADTFELRMEVTL